MTGRGGARRVGGVVLRRAAWAVPLLVIVSIALFVMGALSPFDPVQQYVGAAGAANTDPAVLAQIRTNWGLDEPAHRQYLAWATNLLQGDLGDSLSTNRSVAAAIGSRIGWTTLLISVSLTLLLVGSLVLGTLAAWYRDTVFDRVVRAASYSLIAAPSFWLGLAAIFVFAVALGWFPVGGLSALDSAGPTFTGVLRHLTLPAVVLAVSQSSWFTLFVRETVVGTLREDFVTGARARGLPERTVVFGHARSALLPYLTLIGTHVPELLTGAILIETVFGWPGLGSLTVQAALSFDFPLLAAVTLLGTVAVIGGNLLADLLYTLADPRVTVDG